jgi:hypothetical protein
MKIIFSVLILFCSFVSYGQEQINCVVNNTVMFIPDQKKDEYVIVSKQKDFIICVGYMLTFVVPECDNVIMAFNGKEREILYNPKKKRYNFDGETYKSFQDLLSAVMFFLITN